MTVNRVAKDVVLGLVGTAGLACIIWLVASVIFGVSMVIFRTGSMAPSMPAGTAAIAVPVAAADIARGDVLMVTREGELPVTHRVVEVAADPASADAVVLRLQGDANASPDPRTYRVTEAMRIVFPVPGLGPAVSMAGSPLFMATATLLAATLVVWAFWPAPRREERDDGVRAEDRSTAQVLHEADR